MSMINVSTAIYAAKRLRPISNATTTGVTPTFTSKPKRRKKKLFAKKRWKAARSKPSATTAHKRQKQTSNAQRSTPNVQLRRISRGVGKRTLPGLGFQVLQLQFTGKRKGGSCAPRAMLKHKRREALRSNGAASTAVASNPDLPVR